MALSIVTINDAGTVLRKRASEVKDTTNPRIQKLIDEMIPLMYEKDGIGLAATQVNEGVRVAVLCPRPKKFNEARDTKEALVLINPSITRHSLFKEDSEEGCLSVPEFFGIVRRWRSVTVDYLDREGKKQTVKGNGLFGYCLQHEIDHLDGMLFVDRTKKIYHAPKL
ncbi:MAG: peptide deformylase [Candidatus Uhrbacteria bacterium]|nr:peptide deformylase [Candidatus Uhrbacteria bacterium]